MLRYLSLHPASFICFSYTVMRYWVSLIPWFHSYKMERIIVPPKEHHCEHRKRSCICKNFVPCHMVRGQEMLDENNYKPASRGSSDSLLLTFRIPGSGEVIRIAPWAHYHNSSLVLTIKRSENFNSMATGDAQILCKGKHPHPINIRSEKYAFLNPWYFFMH